MRSIDDESGNSGDEASGQHPGFSVPSHGGGIFGANPGRSAGMNNLRWLRLHIRIHSQTNHLVSVISIHYLMVIF